MICTVVSPFFSYTQPGFVTGLDTQTGFFQIYETNPAYIGQVVPLELTCTSLASGASTTDTFDIVFKEIPSTSGTNPCLEDSIAFQSEIFDFTYTISYPANQLLIMASYNQ